MMLHSHDPASPKLTVNPNTPYRNKNLNWFSYYWLPLCSYQAGARLEIYNKYINNLPFNASKTPNPSPFEPNCWFSNAPQETIETLYYSNWLDHGFKHWGYQKETKGTGRCKCTKCTEWTPAEMQDKADSKEIIIWCAEEACRCSFWLYSMAPEHLWCNLW